MRRVLLAGLLASLSGCASQGVLPTHVPPFTSEHHIILPRPSMGQLQVEAFECSAKGRALGPKAPWRLFNSHGEPQGEVHRESATLELPPGDYVVLGRDASGGTHSAQVIVHQRDLTVLSLPQQSEVFDGALNAQE